MAKPRSPSLGILVESFLSTWLIQQRQASLATLATYKDALRLLFQFASEQLGKHVDQLDIKDLDYDRILMFLDFLEQQRGNSVRTRNARLAVIHSFFRHVAYSDPGALLLAQRILGIGRKRTTTAVVGFLHPPEVDALLSAPCRTSTLGRRDYALLLCLLRTGVRASEAIGINASDLMLELPGQVLIRGKGKKERALPLTNDLATVLHHLVEERGVDTREDIAVFVNTKGQRLTRFGLTHVVSRAVKKAVLTCPSLEKRSVSPHSFRHTAAMRLLQNGIDLAVIRAWLGHSDIQTTHGYLEADIEMKRRALANASVIATPDLHYQPSSTILALLER
jgi:site-specific recombinase XerD